MSVLRMPFYSITSLLGLDRLSRKNQLRMANFGRKANTYKEINYKLGPTILKLAPKYVTIEKIPKHLHTGRGAVMEIYDVEMVVM
jgi:hypothetical protein